MSPRVLELHTPPTAPLDAGPLRPDRLASRTVAEIERLELRHGGGTVAVADLFRVRDGAREELVIAGGSPLLDRVAAEMEGGRLRVEGEVGDELALAMRGGRVEVEGSAGLLAAAAMRGGTVVVRGDVGAFAAACRHGHRFGMGGGVLWVDGTLGPRAGERMRRGIVVAAAAAEGLGVRMLGGTFVIRGEVGPDAGFAMRRGTLLLDRPPADPPPTFVDCGVYDFLFVELLARELAARDLPVPGLRRRWRRLVGCRAAGGKGEMLIATTPP